jgi:hypothetical protein
VGDAKQIKWLNIMRFKLTRELCYLAGLAGHSREPERSQVGIVTQDYEIEERFIKYAIALGVDTKKIMIEDRGGSRHVYFFHSKIARMIREIMNERSTLQHKKGGMAVAFLAGTFDANGHVANGVLSFRRLDKGDELLLELMGIHSVNSRIMNIRGFIPLIKKDSILAGRLKLG